MSHKPFTILAVAFTVMLLGCSSEKKLDATNADTLSNSWKEMYEETPEEGRKALVQGSAFLILDAAGPVFFEQSSFNEWDELAHTEYATSPRVKEAARIDIIKQFDGLTKSDILDAADNPQLENAVPERRYEHIVDSNIL